MSLFPVIVVFGLSFPPIFFELLLSLAIFWLVRRMLVPTGIYDFVWHPALFNTALYCCLFYLISRLFCNFAFFSGLIGAQFWAERAQPKSPELDAKLLVSC